MREGQYRVRQVWDSGEEAVGEWQGWEALVATEEQLLRQRREEGWQVVGNAWGSVVRMMRGREGLTLVFEEKMRE